MRFSYDEWFKVFRFVPCGPFNVMTSYAGIKKHLKDASDEFGFEVPSLERKDLTAAINTAISEGILVVAATEGSKKFYKLIER